jgi:two-component system cell cycle response regulator
MAAARGPCAAWLRAEHLAAAAMRHGGAARDALLLGLADRLTENLRRIDLLAHLGGGSFLLCLPRVSLLEARAIVARLRVATAAAPFDTPVGPVPLRLRTGIAAPEPDQDAAMLAEAARRAATARVAAQEDGRVAPG